MKTALSVLTLAAGLALFGLSPAMAAGCCGGGAGMMCGKGKMDMRAGAMKSARTKKAACCCEGMAGHAGAPMSKKL